MLIFYQKQAPAPLKRDEKIHMSAGQFSRRIVQEDNANSSPTCAVAAIRAYPFNLRVESIGYCAHRW